MQKQLPMGLVLAWPILAFALRRLAPRSKRGLGILLWLAVTAWQVVTWVGVHGTLVAVLSLIQGVSMCVMWAETEEDVAGLGCVWLSCALTWLSLEQSSGTTVPSAVVGLLIVAFAIHWRRRACAIFAAAWGVEYLLQDRGILSVLRLRPQPDTYACGLDLAVDPATVAVCALAVLIVMRLVRMAPWGYTALLSGMCCAAGLGLSPSWLLVVLSAACVALRAARPVGKGAWVLLLVALLGSSTFREFDFVVYAMTYPGNGRPDGVASAEALRLRQHHALSRLPEGAVLLPSSLGDLLPAGLTTGRIRRIFRPRLDVWRGVSTRTPEPAWLVFSNNPEIVPDFKQTIVLMRCDVPRGSGRVFASHFTTAPSPVRLVVQFTNTGSENVALAHRRRADMSDLVATAEFGDAGTLLWQAWLGAGGGRVDTLGPGDAVQDVLEDPGGDGLQMTDVTCDGPLQVSVGTTRLTAEQAGNTLRNDPLTPLRGGQQRGLFLRPDDMLVLDGNLDDGHMRAAMLSDVPLEGIEPGTAQMTRLQGNYGAVTHIRVHLRRSPDSPYRRALVLMVPVGGALGTVYVQKTAFTNCYGALVLYNRLLGPDGDDLSWDYSLPANSYAPVALVLIPLNRVGGGD